MTTRNEIILTAEIEVPAITQIDINRIKSQIRYRALPKARKQAATPNRKKWGKRTGKLRRRWRATKVNPRKDGGQTIIIFKLPLYGIQQDEWEQIRQDAIDKSIPILLESTAEAIQDYFDGNLPVRKVRRG